MNINDIVSQPCMFRDAKSSYALCFEDGRIFQVYPEVSSAKYMMERIQNTKVYEIVQIKGKIIAVLDEV